MLLINSTPIKINLKNCIFKIFFLPRCFLLQSLTDRLIQNTSTLLQTHPDDSQSLDRATFLLPQILKGFRKLQLSTNKHLLSSLPFKSKGLLLLLLLSLPSLFHPPVIYNNSSKNSVLSRPLSPLDPPYSSEENRFSLLSRLCFCLKS